MVDMAGMGERAFVPRVDGGPVRIHRLHEIVPAMGGAEEEGMEATPEKGIKGYSLFSSTGVYS